MIRRVPIPRLGELNLDPPSTYGISQGCIQYQDPNTGQWVSDPNTPACSDGSGGLPDDSGGVDAVNAWAAATAAAATSAAATATLPAQSLVLAESLMSGNVPSPLPGLGISLPISAPVPIPQNWWIWALIGGTVLLVAATSSPQASTSNRRGR